MADVAVSTLYFVATATAAAIGAGNYMPDLGQPALLGKRAAIEKLYERDGKVVATPMLDVAQAEEACPAGYVVDSENKVVRDGETWLVWRVICQRPK